VGDLNSLKTQLDELESHLIKRKPKPCKEIIGQISQYSWQDEISKNLKNLGTFIGKYKFKDAQETVIELKNHMSQL